MADWFALDSSNYSLAIQLFTRLLGAIYVVAYIPFLFQIRGLIGKEGILPVASYLEYYKKRLGRRRFYYLPTLFWLISSDKALQFLVWTGIFLGILLMFGFYPPLILLLLYLVHLSLTTAGQDFLSFGWETFLLEISAATILLTATTPYNYIGWINLNFLLLRFHVTAGASKLLSGDPNWRNLTALAYHYLSQPLPNTFAWYMHKLPLWFHKLSAGLMFYIELIVPLFIFAPPELRLFVFVQLVGLQFFIWLTGNLSYLNHLTVVFCLILLSNHNLEPFLGAPSTSMDPSSLTWQVIISLLGIGLLVLQVIAFWQFFTPRPWLNRIMRMIQPLHIAYRHGIFAVMTTERYEIVIEGSEDGGEWKEYHFYYKPGDLAWRPRRISPYQPRIDWQAWFLPFGEFEDQNWFQQFLVKLLQGSPQVLKLLKHNPFPNKPPRFMRALIYDYTFTSFEEKRQTGNWWKRQLIGEYAPVIFLRQE